MYDGVEVSNKEMALMVLVCFGALLLIFGAGYCIGIRNAGSDVHDNGNGIEPIREQLSTAIQHQQQITSGLESAIAGSHGIEERSDRIEKAAGAAAQSVTDAGILISECQQIIERVRTRGQTGPAAH